MSVGINRIIFQGYKLHCSSSFLRAHLQQASASMLPQLCNDACDSVLIENNVVPPEWGCDPLSSDSTDSNENRIARVITELS